MICEQCQRDTNITLSFHNKHICRSCFSSHQEDRFRCQECNDWVSLASVGSTFDLQKLQLCFSCAFWMEKVDLDKQGISIRVKGKHYIVGKDFSYSKGFGGKHWKIKFHDGREIETNNLWFQGVIPERFRNRLPDNARFV